MSGGVVLNLVHDPSDASQDERPDTISCQAPGLIPTRAWVLLRLRNLQSAIRLRFPRRALTPLCQNSRTLLIGGGSGLGFVLGSPSLPSRAARPKAACNGGSWPPVTPIQLCHNLFHLAWGSPVSAVRDIKARRRALYWRALPDFVGLFAQGSWEIGAGLADWLQAREATPRPGFLAIFDHLGAAQLPPWRRLRRPPSSKTGSSGAATGLWHGSGGSEARAPRVPRTRRESQQAPGRTARILLAWSAERGPCRVVSPSTLPRASTWLKRRASAWLSPKVGGRIP